MSADAELMARMKAGDSVAFGELVDRHKHALVNYLTRLVGNRERAEDLAQDTFLRLYESAPRYEENGRLLPYLYRIAINLVRSEERKEKRRRTLLQLFYPTSANGNGTAPPNPERELLRDESHRQLARALTEVPLKFREPLVLYEIEGWSYQQIAHALGCREGTIKSRISRGRQRLKDQLKEYVQGVTV